MMKRMAIGAAVLGVAALAGCGGGNQGSGGTPTPSSGTVSFPQFVSENITTGTCDAMSPTEVDPIDFTFDADQDTATPFDPSSLTPGCST